MKAIALYIITVNIFGGVFTAIATGIFGLKYLLPLFAIVGPAFGIMCYNYFFYNQYYFFYNLGFTKKYMYRCVFLANVIIALFVFTIVNFL